MNVYSPFIQQIENYGATTNFSLAPTEFDDIFNLVEQQYAEVMNLLLPSISSADLELHNYLNLEKFIIHEKVWNKRRRCLSAARVKLIESSSFFNRLIAELGKFKITDEERLGYGNVYFRIVRPGALNDIGPLHADSWFWEIREDVSGPRLKMWIPLITGGQNAFQFIPSSHKNHSISYTVENRHGERKPALTTDLMTANKQYFGTHLGSSIIFHDRLIHGGILINDLLRVSVEFTLEF